MMVPQEGTTGWGGRDVLRNIAPGRSEQKVLLHKHVSHAVYSDGTDTIASERSTSCVGRAGGDGFSPSERERGRATRSASGLRANRRNGLLG